MFMRVMAVVAAMGAGWFAFDSVGVAAPENGAGKGLEGLSWITGAWVSDQGGRRSEEHWTPAAGGTMFGIGRTIKGERTTFFEYLRIEATDKGIVYYASPVGRCPATPFTMTELSDREVVFANPEHDFPQRIIYRRNDDGSLQARIEGTQNGREQSSEWTWERMD